MNLFLACSLSRNRPAVVPVRLVERLWWVVELRGLSSLGFPGCWNTFLWRLKVVKPVWQHFAIAGLLIGQRLCMLVNEMAMMIVCHDDGLNGCFFF